MQRGGTDVSVVGFNVPAGPPQARRGGAAGLHHADGTLRKEAGLSPYVAVGKLGGLRAF